MARTLINGAEQIQTGTIPLSALVSGYSIPTANLTDGASFIRNTGSVAMAANLSMGGFKLTNLGTPTASTDGVSKGYVDALINGISFHPPCRVLAASNQALSTLSTIDGVTLASGDRVLLTAQTTAAQNGPWIAAAGSWTRPVDWAAAATLTEGAYFLIDPDGTTYKNTKWLCANTGSIVVDTTATTWSQDLSGTLYSPGNGLTLTGVVFAAKLGNALAFDGSNAMTITPDPNGLLTVGSAGIGIVAPSAAQILMGNGSAKPSWQTMSGDATIGSGGGITVNNTSGTGFVKYGNFVWNETPTGSVNGANTSFTLANSPSNSGAALELLLNGQTLEPGSGNDYTISGNAITLLFAPVTGDKLRAYYMK